MDPSLLEPDSSVNSLNEHLEHIRTNMRIAHGKAKENLSTAQTKMKERVDTTTNYPYFTINDLVCLHNPQTSKVKSTKFHKPWKGPYYVTEKVTPVNYRLRRVNGDGRHTILVHVNRLKPAYVSIR
jgi:hypothetical protein